MSQPSLEPVEKLPIRKPKSGVYTMMLVLSLLAIIIGCTFLYAELAEYEFKVFN